MRKIHKFSIFRFLIVFVTFTALVSGTVIAADQSVYVNSAEQSPAPIGSMYAIGDGDISGLSENPELFAISQNGVSEVGATPSIEPSAAPSTEPSVVPTDEPTPTPGVTVSPEPTPEYTDIPVAYNLVKVGLYYGSEALDEVNLGNEIGSGFRFGYYDSNREFHETGRTTARSITIISDWNWITKQQIPIGCYHILKRSSYCSFEDAKAEAERIGGFVGYHSGSYFVQYGNYWTDTDAYNALVSSGIDGEVFTASKNCVVVTETGTNRILYEFDCGATNSLAVKPIAENTEKAVTWVNEQKYYGDFQFARLSGNQYLTVVNYVDIEDYTKGVIPYEVYASWPMETLKAQALCARNYVATSFNKYRAQGFDVTADVYSQVYKGIGDATAETNAAVDATAGQYVRYQGAICQTFFFSSDGGATESSENVWGNKVPYLIGVEDPYEKDVKTYFENWSFTLTPKELQTRVNSRENRNLAEIKEVDCSYTALGNMKSITFTDVNGATHTISGDRCRVIVGTNSLRFTLTQNDNGKFEIEGSGWGHNCGLSQYGAYSMAKHHGKTAEDIIKFYYTGVYIR